MTPHFLGKTVHKVQIPIRIHFRCRCFVDDVVADDACVGGGNLFVLFPSSVESLELVEVVVAGHHHSFPTFVAELAVVALAFRLFSLLVGRVQLD